MSKIIKKMSILLMIILLTGCKGGEQDRSTFSYEDPDSFETPTLNPSDFGFEQNDTLKNVIAAIEKTDGAELNTGEITAILSVLSTNDMHPNAMTREIIDNSLYDYGHNDTPTEIILDEGNMILVQTEILTRDDVACSISGDLTYVKDIYDSLEEGDDIETDISAVGTYSLVTDLDSVAFVESRTYDDESLNSSQRYFYTTENYKNRLNLVQSGKFLLKLAADLIDSNLSDYAKENVATIDEDVVTLTTTITKTISTGGATSMTYSIFYQLIIEDGMIVKTDYHYEEKDEEETVFREIRDLKEFSLEIE